uniref:Titin-like n=1 Tax=Diabrotica virgifera virgifera TaxID=50390 RepID=A0A6P7GUB7_DIAVI
MDEDHHTTYIDGDIVWVKLGPAWWPGQVKDLSKIPSDKIEFKKPPLVLVKFFEEDSYEYVRKWGNIYPYNCEKKIEFIKKGMAAFRSKATHMETFPKDVTTAEVMVGGNPNILSEPQFRPEVKRNYVNEIFGTPNSKKRTNTDNSIKRSTTKTQLDTSHITHRRFLGSDDYKAYICIQYPGKDRIPDSDDEKVVELKTEPEREYDCHTCSYSTKRLEVMILHIKSHIQFEDSPPIKKRKKPVTPKPKKKEPAKSAKRQRMSASQLNDTSNDEAPEPPKERKKKTKTSPSVKKSPKVVEEVKPKNSSDIRNDLLAEWDDEEDELTETENMSITNDLSILSANTTTANDLSILSENTTTANDLSILSENTTTANDLSILSENTTTANDLSILSENTTTANDLSILSENTTTANDLSILSENTTTANDLSILSENTTTANDLSILSENTTTANDLSILSENTTTANDLSILSENTTTANDLSILSENTTTANDLSILSENTTTANDLSILSENTTTANDLSILSENTTTANDLSILSENTTTANDLSILSENTTTAIDQILEPINEPEPEPIDKPEPEPEGKTTENEMKKNLEDDKESAVGEELSPTNKTDDSPKIGPASSGDTNTQNDVKCCFDFNDEEEEVINTTVQVGRKIPRVIPPTEKRKSEILDDIIDLEEGFNKEEILKVSQSFNEKHAENNELESAFKDLMDEVSVPKISELENSLKPTQNFHSVKTIKFPDKQDGPPKKDRDKNRPDVHTEPINPKKRFVKNFEEFENQLQREKVKSKKQQALKKKSRKEILLQGNNDDSSDKTSDDDCKDLPTKIMSSILDEAKISEESKEKIMSKLNKSTRGRNVDSCSTDSNAEVPSPSEKADSKGKQKKFDKNVSTSEVVDINTSHKNQGRIRKFFRKSTELNTVDMSKSQQQEPTVTDVRCTNKTEESLIDDTNLKQQEIGTSTLLATTASVYTNKMAFKKRSLRSSSEFSILDKSHHIEPVLSPEIVYSSEKDDKKRKKHDKHKKIQPESMAGVDDSGGQKEKEVVKDLSHTGATRRQHYSLSEINVETSNDQKEALINVDDKQDQAKAISKTRKSLRNYSTEKQLQNETVHSDNVVTGDITQEKPSTVTNEPLGVNNAENKVVFSQDFYIRDNSKKETLPRKKRKFVTDSFSEASVDQLNVHSGVVAHQERVIDTLLEETLPLKRRRSLRVSSSEAATKDTAIIHQGKEELNTTIAPTNASNDDSTEKNQKGKDSSDKTRWSKRISHPKKRTRSFPDNFDIVETKPAVNENITVTDDSQNLEVKESVIVSIDHEQNERPSELGDTENKKETVDFTENTGAETHEELNDSKTQISDCVPHESATNNVETESESEPLQIRVEEEDAVYLMDNKEPKLITENAALLDSNSLKLQEDVALQSSSEILVNDHKYEETEQEPVQQCTGDEKNVVREVCISESENISVIDRITDGQDHPIPSDNLNVDVDTNDRLSKKQRRNKRKSSKHKHKKKGKTSKEYYRNVELRNDSDIESSNIEVNPSKTPIGDSVVEEVSNFSQSAQSEAEIVNKEAATIKEMIIEKNTVDLTEEIDYIPEHEPVTDENYISMTESKEITSAKQSTENEFSEIKETNELIVTDEAIDSCVDKEKPLLDETKESTEFVDQTERDSAKVQEATEPEVYLTHDEQPPKELIKTQKSSILGVISSDEEELIKKYLTPEEPSEEHTLEKPVVTQEVTVDNFCGSTDGFDLTPEVSFKKQTLEEPVVTQEATVPEDLSVSKKEEVEVNQEATIPEDLSISKEEEFNFSPEVQEQTVEEPIITREATVPEDLSVSKVDEFNTSPEVQLQEQTLEELVVTREETIPEDLSVSKEEEYNVTPEVLIKEQTLEEPVVIQEETILEDLSITKEEVNLTPSELSEEQVNEVEPSVSEEVTLLETLSREEHVVTKEEELLDNIPVSNEDEFNFTLEVQSEKQLKDEEDVLSQEVTTLEQPAISNEQFDVVSEAESEELPHEEPVVIEETPMHLQTEEYNITTEKPVKPCPTNEDFYLPLDRKVEEQPQEEEPIVTQEEPTSEEPFSTNEEIRLTEEESIQEHALIIHDAQQEEPVDSSEELTLQLEKEPSEEVAVDIEDTLVEKDFEHDVEGINRSPQQPEFLIEEQSPEVRETLIIEEPVDSNEQALDLTQDIHSEKQVPFAFDEKESKFDQNETPSAEAFAPKEENIMVNEEAEFMKQPHVLMDEQKSTVTQQIENLETPFATKADATEILQPVEEPQLIEEVVEEMCDTPEEKLTVIHKNKSIEEHVEVPAKLPTEIQPTELELHSINKTETTVIKKLKSRFYEITGLNVHQEPQLNQSGTDNSGVTNAAHLSVIQKASDIVDDEKLDAIQGTQANNEVTVIQELIQEPQLDVIEECVVHEDIQSSVLSEPADEVPRSSTPTDEYAVLKSATSKEQLTNEKLLDTNEEGNQYRTKLSAIEECLEKPIAHQEFGVTSRREIVFHETPKQSNSSDDSEDLTVKKIIDSSVKDQDKLSKKLPDSIFKVPASCVSKSEVRYKKNTFEHRPELKKGMNFTDLDEVDENITDLVSDIVKKLNQDGSDKNQEDLDIELEEEIIDISAKSRSPKVDLSKVLQNDMLTASFEDDPCRIKNYIEPSYSESITGLEKSGENSQSPIENKTENTQRVEEYSKELEIHCANSNDSFKFCIQTNLSNLSRSEEISAIALATMSELKCDSEPATINNNVPADDLPKPDMFSEKLSETEMAAIEGNLTVMSEKDLGDAQVEITSEKVISPKKPVTLSSFSMDFSESTSENDKNLEKNSKGTEFTSRAITKELKPRANVKKINAYNQGELLDILEGNDPSRKAPELQSQPKIVEDVECDFDEIISKNLISKDGVKSVDEESKSSPFSSKLFDRLLDGKSDSAGQEPATETLPKQKSKSKPVILSEKIIKAAPENKKVIPSSDSIVNDDDDLKTFVIQNIKKHIEEDDPVPASKPIRKSRAKPSCKAKILQQTIITPSGEVLQPTGCLPKKKTILISPTTSTVSARVLFNPNNQRLLSYSTLSGSKIVKNVLKSNLIQKNVSSVIKNEVGPTKSPTQIVQKVLPASNQMLSVPSTSRTVKTVVRKVSPSTSKLPTTVKNSKTILLTGKNGQTIKKIAVAEDDIDKQSGTPKVDNAKIELPLTLPITIGQPQQQSLSLPITIEHQRPQQQSLSIPLTIEHQRPQQQSLHVLQPQQSQQEQHITSLPDTPVMNVEVASSNGDQPQHILVSGDDLATQKFLETLSGNKLDLATLIANAEGKSIVIQTVNQEIIINTSTDHPMLSNVTENTESGRNPIFATHSNKTDILAAALADTDVFSTQPSRGAQLSPNNALYPINVGNVLETSLTLSSPIMTPLEVPSTNNKKISEDEADILTQVPKNVDLPITITDPNISQTVANQQVALMGNEFQSNLELGLSIAETTISSVTTGLTSPSYSYSLPSLDENDISHKPFNSSMPLLNDDAEDTNLSHKKSNKHVDKSDLNSDDYLEQSRYTLGGTMCDSLSEPPPEMFEMPEVNSYNERNGSNIPLYLQSTPDPKDDDGMDASIQAESSSEGSCEIPLQPKIVAKSVDLSEESDL